MANEETKILDYITISGYETDAAGNLIIKTTMTNECEQIVKKLDARNFLSRTIEIKCRPFNASATNKNEVSTENTSESGFIFSVHEFFTDMLVADLSESEIRLDISAIKSASRTYNQQKNVRSIYTWTGLGANIAGANVASYHNYVHEVPNAVFFSVASFDKDGMYRLRMYSNECKKLNGIVLNVIEKKPSDIVSHPDGNDYLLSPDEFDVKALDEIRKTQEQSITDGVYSFTYDQLLENVLIDMGHHIEFDVPESCLLVVDGEVHASAKHIEFVDKFNLSGCPTNSLIVLDKTGTMGLFSKYDSEKIYLTYVFNAKAGNVYDRENKSLNNFYCESPRLANDEDVRVYNTKIRVQHIKYNPDERTLIPIVKSLKPGDKYFRPEFNALTGRFESKEYEFSGTADEFTIIVERKLGFRSKDKCNDLVVEYNKKLSSVSSELSDLD